MAKIEVVVPSHRRAGMVTTHRHIAGCLICIPESQVEEYAKHHPRETLVAHPDSVIGLTPKREWIRNAFPSAFQIDDDCKGFERVYRRLDDSRPKMMEPDEARSAIEQAADITRQMGLHLFGFAGMARWLWYVESRPLRFGPAIHGGIGLLEGSKLWWPTHINMVAEDDWISLLNAHHHRRMYKDTRFAPVFAATGTRKGGCEGVRSAANGKRTLDFIVEHFGREPLAKSVIDETGVAINLKLPFKV